MYRLFSVAIEFYATLALSDCILSVVAHVAAAFSRLQTTTPVFHLATLKGKKHMFRSNVVDFPFSLLASVLEYTFDASGA